MQTFLPYHNFRRSAESLDPKRCGKQCTEAKMILKVILGETHTWKDPKAWANHAAVRMWRGHPACLADYTLEVCEADRQRYGRYRKDYHDVLFLIAKYDLLRSDFTVPKWLGDPDFHVAHRSMLVYKLPAHYIPLFGRLRYRPYIWPV